MGREICDKGKIVNYAFDVKLVHVYISEEKWWYLLSNMSKSSKQMYNNCLN